MKANKFFALLLLLAMLLNVNALAEEKIDVNRAVRLEVEFKDDGAGLPGAQFSIYRVAGVNKSGKLNVLAPFDKYNVDFSDLSESGMAGVAATLEGYVLRDQLTPAYTASTDATGSIVFPSGQLKQGLYLITGSRYTANGLVYTIQPCIVQLPSWDLLNEK